jgi:hypothetical protein
MKGLKIRVPDVPAYTRHAQGLRRQPHADRLRRGLPGAAERHRRRAGEPAHHHRGQEVLRGAEAHHADRPHRRRPDHAGGAARVEQAESDAEKKIFTDVPSRPRRAPRADQEARGRAGRRVQEEGPGRAPGRPPELRRRRAEELAGRIDGLRRRTTTASSRSSKPRMGATPQNAAASPPMAWTCRLRPQGDGDDGEFHAVDEAVDLSGTPLGGWLSLALFWAARGVVFYAVLHPLRAQRLGRLDGGDRALPAHRHGLRRRLHRRGQEQPHPGRFLYRYLPAGLARGCRRGWWTWCASPSSAP